MGGFAAFIGLFYLVGFGVLGYGLWAALRSTQAGDWPTTPGVIQEVTLEHDTDGDGTTYEVKVRYAYFVEGREYEGTRLAFGYGGSGGFAAHEEIRRTLAAAKEVAVRYDPDDPATAVLSYGLHRSIRFVLAFGVTWLAFVIGFTVIGWVAAGGDDVLLRNLSVR